MEEREGKTRKLTVAAVQMRSTLGRRDENMRRATSLIERAASQGAELVVLPELCISGYALTFRVWDAAEPAGGPIERWLGETAARVGAYVGVGTVEAEGEHFYNSYLISDPEGQIVGRVRKTQAEFLLFREGNTDSHIVQTAIGRIGVGICADNHRTFLPELMRERDVDILLMPHAMPAAFKTSRLITQKDVEDAEAKARGIAPLLARIVGVPVVFADQTGSLDDERWLGILGRLMDAEHFRFAGSSMIVDSDLTIGAQLDQEEGVACCEVTLDRRHKPSEAIPDHRGWLSPGPAVMRRIVLPLEIHRGKTGYAWSAERRRRALEISRGRPRTR